MKCCRCSTTVSAPIEVSRTPGAMAICEDCVSLRSLSEKIMRQIDVSQCGECPFCYEFTYSLEDNESLEWACKIKGRRIKNDGNKFPMWCPLNKGEVVVRKEDEKD